MIGPLLLDLLCISMVCDTLQGRPIPGDFPLFVIIAITTVWPPIALWLFWRWWRITRLQEILSVQRGVLIIKRVDFLWDRVERSPLAEIRNLRYSPFCDIPLASNPNTRSQLGLITRDNRRFLGMITFNCDRFWHGFGTYLTVVDCRELINLLKNEFGVHTADEGYQTEMDSLELLGFLTTEDGDRWAEAWNLIEPAGQREVHPLPSTE
jgi:hypothetical protein